MKSKSLPILFILTVFMFSCNEDNQNPYCNILSGYYSVLHGSVIDIQIEASDTDGRIKYVELTIGDAINEVLYSPSDIFVYSLETVNLPSGPQTLTAVAVDDRGGEKEAQWEFTLEGIDILFPDGGETLRQDSTYTIAWESNIEDRVDIVLVNALGEEKILEKDLSSVNQYDWRITNRDAPEGFYRIKVQKSYQEEIHALSEASFEIRSKYAFDVSWFSESFRFYDYYRMDLLRGETYSIWWEDNFSESVQIDLCRAPIREAGYDGSVDPGSDKIETFLTLEENFRNVGSYVWEVPADLPVSEEYFSDTHEENSYLYMIKVTSNTNSSFSAYTQPAAYVIDENFLSSLKITEDDFVPGARIHLFWMGDQDVRCYLTRGGQDLSGVLSGEVEDPITWSKYQYGFKGIIPMDEVSVGGDYRMVVQSLENPEIEIQTRTFSLREAPYDISGDWEFSAHLEGVRLYTNEREIRINRDGTMLISGENDVASWGFEDSGYSIGSDAMFYTCLYELNDICREREKYWLQKGAIEGGNTITGEVYIQYGDPKDYTWNIGTYTMHKK